MKRITVFCGSNAGIEPLYTEMAWSLGKIIASRNIELVYGGGKVGLMGIIANSVLDHGGKVIGVIPGFLKMKEVAHQGCTELIVTESMHERKTKMAELGDAFIAMPGGIGTLEELAEIFTWSVLALHKKPVGLLNVKGYYDPLIQFFNQMVEQRFLHVDNRKIVVVNSLPNKLLELMEEYAAPSGEKWLDNSLL